jgi:hypothetical protein
MTKRPSFQARDLGELINSLPAMYGFPPEDSLVVLGLKGTRIVFGMRLDLPEPDLIESVAELAVKHLRHQRVEGAIVVAVGEPLDIGRRTVLAVESRLDSVRPIAGGWANDERFWVSMAGGDPGGYPYRRTLDHPASAYAVLAGQEISASREVLATRVQPEGGERRAWIERSADETVERFVADYGRLSAEKLVARATEEFVPVVHDLLARRAVEDGTILRLGFALTVIEIRDVLWGLITRDNAPSLVGAWLHVARRLPVEWTPAALCLASFASWLSGDGAMAVIAAERATVVDHEYSMADLMLALATSGVSPLDWDGWRESGPGRGRDDRAAS